MLTTLDHLEQHLKQEKKKSILYTFASEIKVFTIIFVIVFVISSVTTNAQLYSEAFGDLIDQLSGSVENTIRAWAPSWASHTSSKQKEISAENLIKKMAIEQIDTTVQSLGITRDKDFVATDITNSHLKQDLDSYMMTFNTLPPTDRIIIPDLDVNVPLLQSSFTNNITQITKEDMDKDLYKGVVQYPTTPLAGQWGNTLVFWHTSYESRKHNPYATVFAKLPKLTNGNIMQVIQNGKLYEYEMVDRKIVAPSQVNEEYMKYTKGNYLTLLGCYPIGSDKQRIMIIGKLKE